MSGTLAKVHVDGDRIVRIEDRENYPSGPLAGGIIIVEAMKRAGADLTRAKLISSLESLLGTRNMVQCRFYNVWAIPISAMPVATVRRRSCSRHDGVFIASSGRRFILDQPLIGDRPVVVKISPSLPPPTSFRARGVQRDNMRPLVLGSRAWDVPARAVVAQLGSRHPGRPTPELQRLRQSGIARKRKRRSAAQPAPAGRSADHLIVGRSADRRRSCRRGPRTREESARVRPTPLKTADLSMPRVP